MRPGWRRLEDLPEDPGSLTSGELGPLLQVWNDQRVHLEGEGVLAGFLERLGREWAIETGQIEGVYDLDRGVTKTLIERGINADLIPRAPGRLSPEVTAAIIRDHGAVLEGLFQFVKGDRGLTRGYVNELHHALLRSQDTATALDQFGNLFEVELLKGQYKKLINNPTRPDGTVHEYCPPEHVASEMDQLLSWHAEHELGGVPLEVEAAWLHHRFAQIHPYQDGNGRVARALASLVFLKAGWFPVVVTRDDRARYIDALEVADEGDLRSLISFFEDVQKRSLFQAMQVAADLEPAETVDDAIAAARKVLVGVGQSLEPSVWLGAKGTADRLIDIAEAEVNRVVARLTQNISEARHEFKFSLAKGAGLLSKEQLGYDSNKLDYDRAVFLVLASVRTGLITVEGHAVGSKSRGLIALGSAFRRPDNQVVPTSEEIFQVNYVELKENAERRFRPWLEKALARGLTLWRQSL